MLSLLCTLTFQASKNVLLPPSYSFNNIYLTDGMASFFLCGALMCDPLLL